MTRKNTQTSPPVSAEKKAVKLAFCFPPSTEEAKAMARLALRPSVNAAAVVNEYTKSFGEQDFGALVEAIADTNVAVQNGDMRKVEVMLMGQAQALQAMFMSFSRRAVMQENQKHLESFFSMALKAQNQCRMTLQTLSEVKNPRVSVFAGQANVTSGPQQVNNGVDASQSPAHVEIKKTNVTNELLENSNGERLDTRAPGKTGRIDQAMETVGEKHRTQNRNRQGGQ